MPSMTSLATAARKIDWLSMRSTANAFTFLISAVAITFLVIMGIGLYNYLFQI